MRWRVALTLALAVLLAGCGEKAFHWQEPKPPQGPVVFRDDLEVRPVLSGLDQPILALPVPDRPGHVAIVEQTGRIQLMREGRLADVPFLDLSDRVGNCHFEQGLLGLAFAPSYATDHRFYVTYTDLPCDPEAKPERKGDLHVARFVADDSLLHATTTSEETLLVIPKPYRNHNGGHLAFGPDGMLYVGVGDGGGHLDPKGNGQKRDTLLGKILRLDVSGPSGYRAPADNPFAGDPDARPEIWMWGLRNPWGFDFDTANGDLWVADVGEDHLEEINRLTPAQQPGANLGWSLFEGTGRVKRGDEPAGLVWPVAQYNHTEGSCAITGGPFLRGTSLAGLEGAYMFSDFCSGRLWALLPAGNGTWSMQVLADTGLQVTGFGSDGAGRIFLLHWSGFLYEVVPKTAPPSP